MYGAFTLTQAPEFHSPLGFNKAPQVSPVESMLGSPCFQLVNVKGEPSVQEKTPVPKSSFAPVTTAPEPAIPATGKKHDTSLLAYT